MEILQIFLSLIILTLINLFAGKILSNFLFKKDQRILELHELGFLGLILFTFISFFAHFFFPLNYFTNSFVILTIIVLFVINFEKNIKIFKSINLKVLSISLIIIFIMTLKYKPNEDYGYYHLPYIITLISEKIVFGLSNLQSNFAWNSSWLNFSSMFYVPTLSLKGTQLSNSILYFFVIYFFLIEIINSKKIFNLSKIFLFFLACYSIIKFTRISEHGFDLPANIFLLLSSFYFIKLFEESKVNYIKKYFILSSSFSILSLTIKLSTFAGPFLIVSSLIYITKKKINLSFVKNSFIFFSLFLLFWLIQQTIYSGCLSSFFKFTCFENVSWYDESISNNVSQATGAVNKSFNAYSGILNREEYVQNLNWVSTWFYRNKIELLEHFIAYAIPVIIFVIFILIYNKSEKLLLKLNEKKLFFISYFTFTILGLTIWFLKSPVIRFGIPYLFISCFLVTSYFINTISLKNPRIKKGIYMILIISIFFNISKNLSRIANSKNTIWPEILKPNYSSIIKDDFVINYPDSKNNFHKLKYCWSIPFICHIGKGVNLKIKKKRNYIFIEKKK